MRPEHCKIVVRHSSSCPDKKKGSTYERCKCRKSLLVYHPEGRYQERVKTGERDWSKAVDYRQGYLARNSPEVQKDLQELDERRAKDEIAANVKDRRVTVESAIVAYINKLRSDKKREGTIINAQSLFGYADPLCSKVTQSGKFLKWLHGRIIQNKYLDEITPEEIDAFVASWKLGDTTENSYRQRIRSFFKFCVEREWIERNPARSLRKIKIEMGNRTTAFTDQQFQDILKAIENYVPTGRAGIVERDWKKRLLAYVNLLRYSGMDLADATQFRQSYLEGNVLVYKRQKTGVQTWPILVPAHVAQMLRTVPDQYGMVGADMPFRTASINLRDDCRNWRWRLKRVFEMAGIDSVETDVREDRLPHPKMFRDTFALDHLNSGVPVLNVSKMLGHLSVKTTIDYYIPKTKSRDDAHMAILRKAAGQA